jgi:hypothetical protein
MIYHKEIDDNFLSYGIQHINYKELFDPKFITDHEWVNYPIVNIFTPDGLKFFSDRNIKLRETTRIFRLRAGIESLIHIDSDYYDAAFNFVLEGQGEMQWVTMDGVESTGSYTQSNTDSGSYRRFVEFTNLAINERWSGKCALVRINSPHRVVGGTVDRYCISVRPTMDHFFDDLVSLI